MQRYVTLVNFVQNAVPLLLTVTLQQRKGPNVKIFSAAELLNSPKNLQAIGLT